MARPKKIGLDYFPVDVSWDQKMQAFDLLCKNDGITFIIYFWQAAYQTASGEVDLSGLFGELMANKCRITTEQLEKILQTAKKIDLLYQTETGSWTSNGIKKRISSVSKERSDAILRQEESKGKKSKVKECLHYSSNNDSYSPNNRIAVKLWRSIVSAGTAQKPPSIPAWAEDIRKCHDIDKRSWDFIYRTMINARNDDFWKKNIKSAKTLREKINEGKLDIFSPKMEDCILDDDFIANVRAAIDQEKAEVQR